MAFFAILGWCIAFGVTFGSGLFILFQGWVMSRLGGGGYPVGALVAASIFFALGAVVIHFAPFHIALTP
jgi:hypothetical protein